ncbi:MAG TPA: M56 family metallopeptidase, partial [Blastocatellia bacterium]|nr:M56 family metallopeptidase [Blastocatellia bacterium]
MNQATDWVTGFATHGAVELLVWSWQAAVLITLVWLGFRIFRPSSPSLRHHLWLLCLVAVAVLPLTARLVEKFPAAQPASPALRYVIEMPRSIVDDGVAQTMTAPSTRAAQVPPNIGRFNWLKGARIIPSLLFVIWLTGAIVAATPLVYSYFKLRLAIKRGRRSTRADFSCHELRALPGDVRLCLSHSVQSPILFGLFHPTILVPSDIAEWTTAEERRAMIQHELAHAERRDPLINLFQNTLQAVLFFHPLVRYACRQLSIEREIACDDRVVSLGTAADAYAESILKVAERCISHARVSAGVHQLALFSARQILERRIEMILNRDRVRLVARQWKYLVLPACFIAAAVWLLAPGSIAKPGSQDGNRFPMDTAGLKDLLVKYMGDSKAYDDLIDMALRNPDPDLRYKAVLRLTNIEGDGSTGALVQLYGETNDPAVKEIVIHNLGRRSEIEPLAIIARTDPSPQFRELALEVIKWLNETSDSNDAKTIALDVLVKSDPSGKQSVRIEPKYYSVDDGEPSSRILATEMKAVADGNVAFDRRSDRNEYRVLYQEGRKTPPPPPPPPPHPDELTVTIDSEPVASTSGTRDSAIFLLLRQAVYASLRHDPSVFERILASDYVGTDPDGRVFNRVEEIAEVRRLDYDVKKFVFDDYTLSGDEEMAVANFIGTVYFELGSAEASAQFRYTVTLARRQGE